jgi:hypothetical protein
MKRLLALAVVPLLVFTAPAFGGLFCCMGGHCICPPCPECPDCSCPCDQGHHHCSEWKNKHSQEIICTLTTSCECCERIKAAEKLGCRLHADFCCCPEVLNALIGALECDPCWEVRRAAAWSILGQNARTEDGVLALYIASKIDPHYLVRARAAEALDILTLCRKECFKCTYERADELIKELKKNKWKPGTCECRIISVSSGCCQGGCGGCSSCGGCQSGCGCGALGVPALPAVTPGVVPVVPGEPMPKSTSSISVDSGIAPVVQERPGQ